MIELLHDDCMNVMAKYPDKYFELAIVDPPYGIGETGQRNLTGDRPTLKWRKPQSQIYKVFNDTETPNKEYFKELLRVSKNQIIWGGNYFTEYLTPSKGWIIWDKQADIKEHLSMCELAWTSFDVKCNKYEYLWAGFKKKHQIERVHPTQKPVDLYRWILNFYAKPNDKILDTHLGSGSIAIACHDMGFSLVGVEIDEDYYKAACKRFKEQTAQLKLTL